MTQKFNKSDEVKKNSFVCWKQVIQWNYSFNFSLTFLVIYLEFQDFKETGCLLRDVLSPIPMRNFEKSKLKLNNLMTTAILFVVSFYAPEE